MTEHVHQVSASPDVATLRLGDSSYPVRPLTMRAVLEAGRIGREQAKAKESGDFAQVIEYEIEALRLHVPTLEREALLDLDMSAFNELQRFVSAAQQRRVEGDEQEDRADPQ